VIYSAYGLIVSSTFPLPELSERPAVSGSAVLRITRSSRAVSERGWTWFQARPKRRKGSWVAVAHRRGEYRLLFDGGAGFLLRPGAGSTAAGMNAAGSITAFARSSQSPVRMRHRLIDQVVPLAMSHFGRIVLHASAVAADGAAVAFVGPAGAGKSTLAAAFAHRGNAVVADDALFLEESRGQWFAVPAYPGIRVLRRGATTKRRLTPDDGVAFARNTLPLRRVYVLKESARRERIRIGRLQPRDAIMALVEYAFVLDTEDRERMAAHFARVSAAAAGLDIRELTYPRRMAALPDVRDAVMADIEAG
jgi:hypothetical protein